ncbi:MAG: hypothetical protein EB060_04420 [Proteobacteria bacterium]|nr:hypothetical protein [Pseudomonadota bacterium]
MAIIFNAIGVLGVFAILAAYFGLQARKLSSNDMVYWLLNLSGALLVLVSLYWDWNLPQFVLEVSWSTVSIFGIYKILKKQEENKSPPTGGSL